MWSAYCLSTLYGTREVIRKATAPSAIMPSCFRATNSNGADERVSKPSEADKNIKYPNKVRAATMAKNILSCCLRIEGIARFSTLDYPTKPQSSQLWRTRKKKPNSALLLCSLANQWPQSDDEAELCEKSSCHAIS